MTADPHGKLSELSLRSSYRGSASKLLHEFYVPCLSEASEYRRAVGYFSSDILAAAARGLSAFIGHEGKMLLVASPKLEEEDIRAINEGYRRKEEVVEESLCRTLRVDACPDPVRERLALLAWLISESRLEIKIALIKTASGFGLYHEKLGIFTDTSGDCVVFTGSANETVGGMVSNFESVDVFRSWRSADEERVDSKRQAFRALWNDETENLIVMDFPDAARKRLLEHRPKSKPLLEPDPADDDAASASGPDDDLGWGSPRIPDGLELRGYQKDAISRWLEGDGKGIWRMATGTGKTITALSLVSVLHDNMNQNGRGLACIVICPFKHLVEQWAEEARSFGVFALRCFESRATWERYLREGIEAVDNGLSTFFMAITTNSTLQSPTFTAALKQAEPTQLLIIGDEVHNLGAAKLREALPEKARYTLGLSATPERWFDAEGTQALLDYFGPVVYELGLAEAIGLGALCHYLYYPHFVEFTDEEFATYLALSKRIAQLAGADPETAVGEQTSGGLLEMLLFKRARLIASASGKLDALRSIMEPLRSSSHNLVYCGDGRVETARDDETERQINEVVRILGRELAMSTNSYTAETYLSARSSLRRRFAAGELQNLVAIRCLDEGVDIPETRRAIILASSTNPKQWIQRRGRVLRLSRGKTVAEIHDLLVIPEVSMLSDQVYNIERRLVQRELERVLEFANLADNRIDAMHSLLPAQEAYGLLHMG